MHEGRAVGPDNVKYIIRTDIMYQRKVSSGVDYIVFCPIGHVSNEG